MSSRELSDKINDTAIADRLQGAMLGAFIGDALGVGPHWYYDLDEMRRHYGQWISDYTKPLPGHYHERLKPGELSQSGRIMLMLLKSLGDCGGYLRDDFTARMDDEMLPLIDGTPHCGPGGFTNQSIRELHQARVVEGRDWGRTGAWADTTEAAERNILLGVRYAHDPETLADIAAAHCRLTQVDPVVVAHSTVLPLVIGQLVIGARIGEVIGQLRRRMQQGRLSWTRSRWTGESSDQPGAGETSMFDALLVPATSVGMAFNADLRIEPAWRIAQVHGMACAFYMVLPAAYYLGARFHDDFEAGILHAINGGGQNMSRACITGALLGAQVGRSGIPGRFIGGLSDHDEILDLTAKVAAQTVKAMR